MRDFSSLTRAAAWPASAAPGQTPPLDGEDTLRLYRSCIRTPEGVAGADILPGLKLLADFLGQTNRMLRPTHNTPSQSRRYHNSSEDIIGISPTEFRRRFQDQLPSTPEAETQEPPLPQPRRDTVGHRIPPP